MHRCTSPIRTAHGSAMWSFLAFYARLQNGQRPLFRSRPRLGQYFPKKTKATYTAAYLADCRQKLNTRPRKCLGFAFPASRFFFELRWLHFRVESAPKFFKPLLDFITSPSSNSTTIFFNRCWLVFIRWLLQELYYPSTLTNDDLLARYFKFPNNPKQGSTKTLKEEQEELFNRKHEEIKSEDK